MRSDVHVDPLGTLIRIIEELRELGYEGSYDAVRRYAKKWRVERGAATAEAYVPLSFAPGEAYQFDWSHEIVLIIFDRYFAGIYRFVFGSLALGKY